MKGEILRRPYLLHPWLASILICLFCQAGLAAWTKAAEPAPVNNHPVQAVSSEHQASPLVAKALQTGLNAASEGDWTAAFSEFEKACILDPQNASAYYGLGVANYHLGQFNAAIVDEQQALASDHHLQPAYIELSTIYTRMGLFNEARKALKQLLDLHPDDVEAQASLHVLESMHHPATASTTKQPGTHEAAASEGQEPPSTLSTFLKPSAMHRNKDMDGLLHDSDLAFNRGDLQRAKYSMRLAISLDPDYPEDRTQLSAILVAAGEPDAAIIEARKAVDLNPFSGYPHMILAWVLSRKNMWAEALKEYSQAYKLDKSLDQALVDRRLPLPRPGK